ncbi:hypothetical protein EJ110_NYTH53283 [Nymphaea thermarum]|nr:hypothetical protein EJ110_NYTH53283 [Nymphaea thermarum]
MAESRKHRKPARRAHSGLDRTHKPFSSSLQRPPSWSVLRDLLTCTHLESAGDKRRKYKKIGCSGSLCNLRDNTRVMQRPEITADAVKKCIHSKNDVIVNVGGFRRPLKSCPSEVRSVSSGSVSSKAFSCSSISSTFNGGSLRAAQLKRLSGCYECHAVVDPLSGMSRFASPRGTSINACGHCGEMFAKADTLELHLSTKHAVSELGPDDSSRNIVEIIFQSSWLKKESPVCKIDRILKVHNSQKTINKFEDYRDSVKAKANKLTKKHARCIADGNELLRFHCTTFNCSIGLNGTSTLCNSIADCNVCNIIKNGFKIEGTGGICTTASSGKAHDSMKTRSNEKRAMLVCRVIAGRIKKNHDAIEELTSCSGYDSVAGHSGTYSSLDELYVFNARAILPCFVVIYRALD